MARLTITLSDACHRALKEAAVRRGKPIGQLIEESLDYSATKTPERAAALVARARERAGLRGRDALDPAGTETRRARGDARSARGH